MQVTVSSLSAGDGAEFVAALLASRSLHRPWIDPPDSPGRFAAYLELAGREDQAAYLVRHRACGMPVGYVRISNIVRRAFQSASLGYGAFASHAALGLMREGLQATLSIAFSDLGLHRLEANIEPANERSIALVRRLGFEKEGFSPHYLMVDGDWRDHERWALRAETWASRP